VLQQQTVRSIQEALRQPPVPKPRPTLPAAFQKAVQPVHELQGIGVVETAVAVDVVDVVVDPGLNIAGVSNEQEVVTFVQDGPQSAQIAADTTTLQEAPLTSLMADSSTQHPPSLDPDDLAPLQNQSGQLTAYILSLLDVSSLCSALLFSHQHTLQTNLPANSRPAIILLYPSIWETHPDESTMSALALLRSAIDSPTRAYGHLILHPVPISFIWSGPGMLEGQLLAELQRGRFPYHRMLYLRLPGLAVDISTLDVALSTSDLRRSWSPLSSEFSTRSRSTSSKTISPPIILVSSNRGLLVPRPSLRYLTTSFSTNHEKHHGNEREIEAKMVTKGAAWVLFDEAELEHRRSDQEWQSGVVERFEIGRREVCRESGLLGE